MSNEQNKFCEECGAELQGGLRFCDSCGAAIGSVTEASGAAKTEPVNPNLSQPAAMPASQAQKPKSTAKTVAKVIWSIIGIIAIVGLFILLDELFF